MAHSTAPKLTEPELDRIEVPARPVAIGLLLSLRPQQRTKNLIIFAGLIFGQRLLDPAAIARSAAAFAIFCVLSGVVYLINDIPDREADRRHPLNRNRPIASGQVPVAWAVGKAIVLGVGSLAAALMLGRMFGLVAALYVALQTMYLGP